jgi:hypothetical protein
MTLSTFWRSGTPYTSSKSRQGAGRASTRCHVTCSFHLPVEVGSRVVTCPATPDLTSLSRWDPALSRVPWLQALSSWVESFGAVTCSSALDLVSLSRWALPLPRGPGLASPRGELRCCHVSHDPQWVVDHRNKEESSYPRHVAELACV